MDRGNWVLLVAASLSFFSCSSFLSTYQMNLILQMSPAQEISQVQDAFFAKEHIAPENPDYKMEVSNKPSPIKWDALRYVDLLERYP